MFERVSQSFYSVRRRARRVLHRDPLDPVRWATSIDHFRHLTALVFVPLLVALVVVISNTVDPLSFLLFPPLAAAIYELFANPGQGDPSPADVVYGLTIGAMSGWAALIVAGAVFGPPPSGRFQIGVGAAVLSVLFTGGLLWLLDIELAPAFAVALLVLLLDVPPGAYVVSVVTASVLVAAVFVVWRREVYDRRVEYLYEVSSGARRVLIPVRGGNAEQAALFGARLAATRGASEVVLLGIVPGAEPTDGVADAERLEGLASRLREETGVHCEVLIADDRTRQPAEATIRATRESNCDLVVAPYEETHEGKPGASPFVRRLFGSDHDVIAVRIGTDGRSWDRALVLARRAGTTAHAMVDSARRLVGSEGRVSVCSCIDGEAERRAAETTCAELAEAFDGSFETRVANTPVEEFVADNAPDYDAVFIGAGTDRTRASRVISPPTFRTVRADDCDLAVVHRG